MKTRSAGRRGSPIFAPAKKSRGRRLPAPYLRRLACESLEDRCLLDGALGQQAIQLFDASPALFVENLGQWSDPAVRYAFQGSGTTSCTRRPGR